MLRQRQNRSDPLSCEGSSREKKLYEMRRAGQERLGVAVPGARLLVDKPTTSSILRPKQPKRVVFFHLSIENIRAPDYHLMLVLALNFLKPGHIDPGFLFLGPKSVEFSSCGVRCDR